MYQRTRVVQWQMTKQKLVNCKSELHTSWKSRVSFTWAKQLEISWLQHMVVENTCIKHRSACILRT